jgi:hypothetical protein
MSVFPYEALYARRLTPPFPGSQLLLTQCGKMLKGAFRHTDVIALFAATCCFGVTLFFGIGQILAALP